jgi:predicted nucleic acid-binding protein
MILLDTNLLIRMTRSQDPQAVSRVRRLGHSWGGESG